MKICTIEGCGRKFKAKGFCDLHYYRFRVNGDPLTFKEKYTKKKLTKEEFFWLNIEKTNYCWIWKGNKNKDGYGRINFYSKHQLAHRYAYELLIGSIPENKLICHECDNPCCCNPKHLFIGSERDNMDDMVNKGRHVGCRKLNESQVKEIKELLKTELTQPEIAKMYKVSRGAISNIAYEITWKSIK